MIIALSPVMPACYGITCARHHQCARYDAVEETSPDHTIPLCQDAAGDWPLFSAKATARTEPAEAVA